MTTKTLSRVSAALRDMAAKCDETQEVMRMPPDAMFYTGRDNIPAEPLKIEKYSRDWLSGRLLGMADMIDSGLSEDVKG